MFLNDCICKVAADHVIKVLGSHFDTDIVIDAIVADLTQEVTWMASPHSSSSRQIVFRQQVFDDLRAILALEGLGVVSE